MPKTNRKWTREMVLGLPEDGNRYELFGGELLVTPSPTMPHQLAVGVLWRAIDTYVIEHRLGTTITSPADLHLGGEQLAQPDLFVLSDNDDQKTCPGDEAPASLLTETIVE